MLFGCLTLFTSDSTSAGLVPVIGIFLLALAIVEFANSIYRSYNRQGWAVSTAVAVFDAIFGVLLLFIINEGMTWHLVLIAAYTLLRGIFELAIGFRTTVDPTDRFIWCLCGLCGLLGRFNGLWGLEIQPQFLAGLLWAFGQLLDRHAPSSQ